MKLTLRTQSHLLLVEVAATAQARLRGLRGSLGLEPRDGMLFMFHEEGWRELVMGGVSFPLDIVFLNRDKVVTGVFPDVSPGTGRAWGMAKYVIEVNAGHADWLGLREGETVSW